MKVLISPVWVLEIEQAIVTCSVRVILKGQSQLFSFRSEKLMFSVIPSLRLSTAEPISAFITSIYNFETDIKTYSAFFATKKFFAIMSLQFLFAQKYLGLSVG